MSEVERLNEIISKQDELIAKQAKEIEIHQQRIAKINKMIDEHLKKAK